MSIPVLARIRRNAAETIDEAFAEEWEAHRFDELCQDVENALREFADLPKRVRDYHRQCYHTLHAAAGKPEAVDLQKIGESLRESFDSALVVLKTLRKWVHRLAEGGKSVSGGEDLDETITNLEQFREESVERWPWPPTVDEMAESEKEEGTSLEDTFAEAAGVTVEEWLRRVEEHKSRRDS